MVYIVCLWAGLHNNYGRIVEGMSGDMAGFLYIHILYETCQSSEI